jgi:hypothetical protein
MLPHSDPPAPPSPDRPRPHRRRDRRRWLTPIVPISVLISVLAAGCGGNAATGTGGQAARGTAGPGDALNLRDVCPATVVIQSSWFPEAEHGAEYQLLGKGYRIDPARKRVTGPLVASGVDTGVQLQIRAGGPAIGFQLTSAQMYADRSITLGMLNTDELIQQSKAAPVLGVVAPLDLDPQVIMWDPKAHPDWNTISDIGQTDTRVLYYQTSPFMAYLLGAGILRPSQVDGSYDGTPSRFVASGGKIAVQGYATNEPWAWEHEVPQWGKPLHYQLINDTGYPNYANVLGIRTGDRDKLDGCLHKLVPIIQRAQAQFAHDPGPAITLAANNGYKSGFHYDQPLADYAVKTMLDQAIISNGGNRTLGDFDTGRIARLIGILQPILAGQKKPIKDGLGPVDVTTNAYIDSSIGLPTR